MTRGKMFCRTWPQWAYFLLLLFVVVFCVFLWDLYSLGCSMLSPIGARLRSTWVQCRSTLSLMPMDWGQRGGFLMNSRTLMFRSLCPLWGCVEKCFPTLLSCIPKSMSRRWWTNLSFRRNIVCPTYCMPQRLHVMAYTRFELLHETFFMQLCSWVVYVHVMSPVLLSSGQYLQSFLLQKLNPRVLFPVPPVGFGGWLGPGPVSRVRELHGVGILVPSVVLVMKKLVIDACRSGILVAIGCCVWAVCGVGAETWSGSTSSSPGL